VRLADSVRTATFRTAALAAAAFGGCTLAMFGIIYWQTAGLEAARVDTFVMHESQAIAREPRDIMLADVDTRYARDLHRQSFAAVFGAGGDKLAGALATYPEGLAADGQAHAVTARLGGSTANPAEHVRAAARTLPGGAVLVVGRTDQEAEVLRRLLLRALALVLLPALAAALGIGVFASLRTGRRVRAMNTTLERIVQGHMHERLTVSEGGDALAQLAGSVNRMLDDIGRLLEEIRGVGDDIAHDLRTPLTRLRARLEGALLRAESHQAMAEIMRQAMADLDQAFALITALLRLGQIEGSARRAGFAPVSLGAIAVELEDLYAPLAELRGVALHIHASSDAMVLGDRDLLFEAAANLLDNAMKFTPAGGAVELRAFLDGGDAVLSVRDNGPGIAENERGHVLKRFYRTDRSRNTPGHGLGLSLVAAITRLHAFGLVLADAAPGLDVEIRGRRA
jgi:signal transduction histidine kinase